MKKIDLHWHIPDIPEPIQQTPVRRNSQVTYVVVYVMIIYIVPIAFNIEQTCICLYAK